MSIHAEWDEAATCEIEIVPGWQADEDLQADEVTTSDYVLILGGAGGGCLAIEGSKIEIRALLRRALTAAIALDDTPPPRPDDEDDDEDDD